MQRWFVGRYRALKANWGKALASATLFLVAIGAAFVMRNWAVGLSASDRAFWLGVSSSLLEDSSFFFIVALTVSLMFAPEPQNKDLDERVRYLYDGTHVTSGARKHMAAVVQVSAAIATELDIKLKILERDSTMNALKIEDSRYGVVANMFHREDYHDKLEVGISPDKLEPPPPDGRYGAITDAYFVRDSVKTDLVTAEIPLHRPELCKREFDLDLRPNEKITYHCKTWIWNPLDEPFGVGGPKYTEKLTISVINQTGEEISVKIGSMDGTEKLVTILPGKSADVASLTRVPPRQLVLMKLE